MSLKRQSLKSLVKSSLLVLSIISTSLAFSVSSQAITTIVDAESRQYLSELQSQAEKGDAKAQTELSTMYLYGFKELTASENLDNAVYWLTQAAETDPEAQWIMGRLYLGDRAITINYNKAFTYFEKSAKAGYANGQFDLAKLYRDGKGVTQDYDKALKWYRLSAKQGNPLAINNIGDMYETGHGVPQDFDKAREYYMEVVTSYNSSYHGHQSMGQLYELGRGVEKNLETAKLWYSHACKMNSRIGCERASNIKQQQAKLALE